MVDFLWVGLNMPLWHKIPFPLGDIKLATLGYDEELLSEVVWILVEDFPDWTFFSVVSWSFLHGRWLRFLARCRRACSACVLILFCCVCCGTSFSWLFSYGCLDLMNELSWRYVYSVVWWCNSSVSWLYWVLHRISQNTLIGFAVGLLRRIMWLQRALGQVVSIQKFFFSGPLHSNLVRKRYGLHWGGNDDYPGSSSHRFGIFSTRWWRYYLHLRVGWVCSGKIG